MKWLKISLAIILSLYIGLCAGLYLFQEKLLFHPHTLEADFKYKFPGRFREFNLDIGDGCHINALQFYADTPAKGVVLYFHGKIGRAHV